MTFDLPVIVGLLSSTLTTASLLPQLIKLVKEKKAEGISVLMLVILFAGLAGWIYYGILKEDWVLIIANTLSLIINGIIVGFTMRYKK